MKRAEAYRRRLLDQGRTLEERAVKQAINLMKKDIEEIMAFTKRGEVSQKQKVLEQLKAGVVEREEIAERAGITVKQALDTLRNLQKDGKVKKIDSIKHPKFYGGYRYSAFTIDDAPKPKPQKQNKWAGVNSVFAIGAAVR